MKVPDDVVVALPADEVTVEDIGDRVGCDLPALPGATGAGRLEKEQR